MTTRLQMLTTTAAAALLLAASALPLAAQAPGAGGGMGPGGMGPGGMGPGGMGSGGGMAQGACNPGQMMMLMMDSNQDGKISEEEFRAGHDQHFDALDTNHDGKITFEEFKAWRQPRNEQRMEMMFRRADTDGDGAISRAEFDAKSDLRFERIDANHDKVITEDEIQAMRKNMRGPGMKPGMGPGAGPCVGPGGGPGMMGPQGDTTMPPAAPGKE